MICIHEWDYSPDSADTLFTCLKCGAELYAVDSFNRLNILETNVARLRKEGEEYRAQLAARDALIERLRELITRVTNEVNLWDNQPLLDDLMKESVE